MNQSAKLMQKIKRSWKSNNHMGSNREKSTILYLSQYWKNYNYDSVPKIISHFGGTNTALAA